MFFYQKSRSCLIMPSMYCVVCCGHGTYSEVALSELKWVATIGIESKQKYDTKEKKRKKNRLRLKKMALKIQFEKFDSH